MRPRLRPANKTPELVCFHRAECSIQGFCMETVGHEPLVSPHRWCKQEVSPKQGHFLLPCPLLSLLDLANYRLFLGGETISHPAPWFGDAWGWVCSYGVKLFNLQNYSVSQAQVEPGLLSRVTCVAKSGLLQRGLSFGKKPKEQPSFYSRGLIILWQPEQPDEATVGRVRVWSLGSGVGWFPF